MPKYHISADGTPGVCHAQFGKCPLGGATGAENHFNTIEEAQSFADKMNEASFVDNDLESTRSFAQMRMNKLKEELANLALSTSESDAIRTEISKQHVIYNQADTEIQSMDNILKGIDEPDGGATFNLSGVTPTTGFCASPYPDVSKVFTSASEVDFDALTNFIDNAQTAHPDILSDKETYIGVWNDPKDGKIYVDVSKRYDTAEEARTACENHDQIAFFDLNMFESVEVNANAKSGQAG